MESRSDSQDTLARVEVVAWPREPVVSALLVRTNHSSTKDLQLRAAACSTRFA